MESNFMVIMDGIVYCADVVDNILQKPFSKWQYNSAAAPQTPAAKMPIKLNQQHVSVAVSTKTLHYNLDEGQIYYRVAVLDYISLR